LQGTRPEDALAEDDILSDSVAFALDPAGMAQAEQPVLPQIDLPHPYYYREMFCRN